MEVTTTVSYVEVGPWSDIDPPPGAVVVGYDGRRHGQAALVWAAREAVTADAALLVLYAANYPGMVGPEGPGLLEREPGALDAAQLVTARGVREALEAQPVLRVYGATEVLSPVKALVRASRTASQVVLGSRGRGRVLGALLGSVAFNVAAVAEAPVVVVGEGTQGRVPGPDRPVLVGCDGSSPAEAAVDLAAARAVAAGAELQVVICTSGRDAEAAPDPALRERAEAIVRAATARVQAAHPGLHVGVHVDERPAEAALVARSVEAGLVVVGTRGRGAFEAMVLGSVSHAVIHGAGCPVVVVDDRAHAVRTARTSG